MWVALGFLVALAGVILWGASRTESRSVRVIAGIVAVVLVLPLAVVVGFVVYVATPASGDHVARERAEATAVEIADELVVPLHNSNGALDGEQLALHVVQHADGLGVWGSRDSEITVLGWSGSTAERGGATVDIRVAVHVPYEPGGLLGRDRSEGDAVRCWRLTTEYYEYDESAGLDEIDCPEAPLDRVPVPAGAPSLGPDAKASPGPSRPWLLDEATTPANEKLLLTTLAGLPADAGETAVRDAVSEAFPDYTVDAGREGKEVVATVVGPTHRDCLVGARVGADEPARFTDFPRVQLELGELGCSPSLYWSNVTAH
jgi:hypothetical protein